MSSAGFSPGNCIGLQLTYILPEFGDLLHQITLRIAVLRILNQQLSTPWPSHKFYPKVTSTTQNQQKQSHKNMVYKQKC